MAKKVAVVKVEDAKPGLLERAVTAIKDYGAPFLAGGITGGAALGTKAVEMDAAVATGGLLALGVCTLLVTAETYRAHKARKVAKQASR